MRVIAFGTYDVDAHPRVGALIQGVRDRGHEVEEVNRPLGLDTAQRIAMVRQPWRLPLLALRLLRCWTALTIRGLRARRRRPDAVLVGYLGHFDVHLARLLFRGVPIVLDHLVSASGTAHDRGLSDGGVKDRLMRAIDGAALAAADVPVLDTEVRRGSLPPSAAARAVVCPVGATDPWFATPPPRARAAGEPLKVVFVGLYTPLHGTPVLGEAIAQLADEPISFTLIGKGQDRAETERLAAANPNVTWLDWIAGADLPGVVAAHDVSLGIFGTTAKALEVVPTKVYQGMAAGTVVVTSDTEPQREALAESAVLVPPGDPTALAEALRALAADRDLVLARQQAARALAVERFTAAAIVGPLLAALDPGGPTAQRRRRVQRSRRVRLTADKSRP